MFKKILILFSFLLIIGGAIAYHFWQEFTALPTWYKQPEISQNNPKLNLSNIATVSKAKIDLNNKIKQQILNQSQFKNIDLQPNTMPDFKRQMELKLDNQDINNLIVTTLAENPRQKYLLQSAKAIQTKIENNQLAIEAIVNPSEIQQGSLPDKQKATIGKVLATFPQLKDRDIYLKIKGKPTIKNGQLMLPKDSTIKVGNLSFTIEEITKKLGLSTQQVQQYIELGVGQMNLRDLQVNDHDITVKISQP